MIGWHHDVIEQKIGVADKDAGRRSLVLFDKLGLRKNSSGMTTSKQKLELHWIGEDEHPKLKPRLNETRNWKGGE